MIEAICMAYIKKQAVQFSQLIQKWWDCPREEVVIKIQ